MTNLTDRQQRILDYLRRCPVPPTLREIGAGCGISSTSVVKHHLQKLVESGHVIRRHRARASRQYSLPWNDLRQLKRTNQILGMLVRAQQRRLLKYEQERTGENV